MTHICVCKLTIIGSHDRLLPWRRQAIVWANAGISLIEPLGTNFSEILNWKIFIQESAFENVVCKMSAILSRPQCVKYVSVELLMIVTISDVLVHHITSFKTDSNITQNLATLYVLRPTKIAPRIENNTWHRLSFLYYMYVSLVHQALTRK